MAQNLTVKGNGHSASQQTDRSIIQSALERTRTAMPFGTTPSRWRVYQFHHQGQPNSQLGVFATDATFAIADSELLVSNTGPTGLEPATSRVTVECSNQTELRPQLWSQGRKPLPHSTFHRGLVVSQSVVLDPAAKRKPQPYSVPHPASPVPHPAIAPRGIEPLSAP